MKKMFGTAVFAAALTMCGSAYAFQCAVGESSMDKPGGFPERALTMIVPYGPAGGSGQVAAAMAEAVTELTGVSINRDHKPGGSGTVGMTAYMAAPADGYNVLEHIDDAASAHALDSSVPNPAEDLIPLVVSQVTFSQIYIRSNEDRFTDWPSFVEWVKAQGGRATIANVSKEGSMERVTMRFITDATGMEIQQISFDKGAPRYGALLGAQVDALFEQPGDVRNFLDAGQFKPILTIFDERPGVFADVPTHREMGMEFDPLLRFRGFYVHKDAPADRVEWLQWAFQRGYCEDSYQAFNESKFMTVIDSYRDTDGAKELITRSVSQYRDVYKAMGLDVK
ncbi:tripartite tricarboxylate transporter substrate binding protein [uncultured Tateyamaria sp.]|uniref:tripartite tricarboxylate transporter substrate binding protein n=1 Tax=uncultured Tateyamaria sp. TaxID=455651 RepID=UPI002608EC74|nr:tripartite tricarboxylate transporter substrate binding protein [uncultured Tateyamaria sp.]